MSKIKDGIIGHAIGDAMGVPVEFCMREKLLKHPVMDMIGYGSHPVPEGFWSDDTSMEIALMDSFIANGKFDYDDIMKRFSNWVNYGEYTPDGKVFDIGKTCLRAIKKYVCDNITPIECGSTDFNSNGNGSLMRILPVAYYCYYKKLKSNEIYQLVKEVSSLTHGHEISILGCYIYVSYVLFLLNGKDKFSAYNMVKLIDYSMFDKESLNLYSRILKEDISKLNVDDIKSSGYIVDTLEASLWVLLKSKSYKESIIGAINLGNDTDTIGAITGSMSGIIYGYDDIPKKWLDKLAKRDYLEKLCDNFEFVLIEGKNE